MKRSSLFAVAIAVTSAISFSAQAGSITEYSDTWKPGFSFDDSTHNYTRMKHVEKDTGYNPGSKLITITEVSQSWKPGFQADDNGSFFRVVQVPNSKYNPTFAKKAPHEQSVWAPNHDYDDGKRSFIETN
jgi:hypothetical protein